MYVRLCNAEPHGGGLLNDADAPLRDALDYVGSGAPTELVRALEPLAQGNSLGTFETSGYVVHSLQTTPHDGLFAESAEGAIVTAVNRGGDTDTVGAIAGAIAGGRCGASTLPDRWLGVLGEADELESLAGELKTLRQVRPRWNSRLKLRRDRAGGGGSRVETDSEAGENSASSLFHSHLLGPFVVVRVDDFPARVHSVADDVSRNVTDEEVRDTPATNGVRTDRLGTLSEPNLGTTARTIRLGLDRQRYTRCGRLPTDAKFLLLLPSDCG